MRFRKILIQRALQVCENAPVGASSQSRNALWIKRLGKIAAGVRQIFSENPINRFRAG